MKATKLFSLVLMSVLSVTLFMAFNVFADALDTWTNVATTPYGTVGQVAFGNNRFVVTSPSLSQSSRSGVLTSTDGIHWSQTALPYYYQPTGIVFGNGIFVMSISDTLTFDDAGFVLYSTDGISWGSDMPGGASGLHAVTYGNGMFVAVGYFYENQQGFIYTSTNGQNWNKIYFGTNSLQSVAYGNGLFVAAGYPYSQPTNAAALIASTDGVNWANLGSPVSPAYGGISYFNGLFYASRSNLTWYGQVFGSPASIFWTPLNIPAPRLFVPTSGSNSLYLGTSNGLPGIYTATNKTSWVARATGVTDVITSFAYGNGRFVAPGYSSTNIANAHIYVSGNSSPYVTAQRSNGTQLSISGGLGPTYQLQASTNFTTWTNLTTFTNIGVSAQYLDSAATNLPKRYYRTVSP